MRSRLYPMLVGLWVIAAAVSVAATLARRQAGPPGDGGRVAVPEVGSGSASFETDEGMPGALVGVAVEEVVGWTGPGGRSFLITLRGRGGVDYRHRQVGTESFYLALRLPEPSLDREPCASCHQGRRIIPGRGEEEARAVHQNIQPVHPAQTGAQCRTCHASSDVSDLRLESGELASLDHAYRLCAQCHFRQVEAWAGGAHGKRLVGWRGSRVVLGCADCHDPHRPATRPRLPMAGVSLDGPLGSEAESHGSDGEHGPEESEGHGGGAAAGAGGPHD